MGLSGAIDHRLSTDKKKPEPARHGALARRFRKWLDALLSRTGAGILILERQQGGRGGGAVTLGLRMVALELASGKQLAVVEVWPGEWQAWAKRHGWTKADKDDKADAEWMLRWFMGTYNVEQIITAG